MCIIHSLIKTIRCSLHRLIQTEILRTHCLAILSQESGDTITLIIAGLALGNRASCSIETRARITRRYCGSKNDDCHVLTKQEDVHKWEIPPISCWLGSQLSRVTNLNGRFTANLWYEGWRGDVGTYRVEILRLQQDNAGIYTHSKLFHIKSPLSNGAKYVYKWVIS